MILAYVRTIVLYLALILSLRLMGKRQIGQMEPSEFVVALLVADLAAVPMQDVSIPLLAGIVPLLTVLGLELSLSFLVLKSRKLRTFLCGSPVILIDNGKLRQENLRRTRVTLEELTSHLRQKDVLHISQVQYAILETDGNLSVFPYPQTGEAQTLPVTIIADGVLCRDGLNRAGKDMNWVNRELGRHQAGVENTLLLTLSGKDQVLWIGKTES